MSFPTSLDNLTANNDVADGDDVIQAADIDTLNVAVDSLQTKVGVNSSAVATSHDYLLAHKGSLASGSTVFNTHMTAANTWQDLDLSAVVGAKVALVYLEITTNGVIQIAAKPKGNGSATFANHIESQATADGGGAAVLQMLATGKYKYLLTATDASGVIQIAANVNNVTVTIKLLTYIG
jgi:hypothetical protein